jgi:hypothetical protein
LPRYTRPLIANPFKALLNIDALSRTHRGDVYVVTSSYSDLPPRPFFVGAVVENRAFGKARFLQRHGNQEDFTPP